MDFEDDEDTKATKGPKFPIQMYISEGNHYFRLGQFDLAIEFYNKGLEKEPANEKCLIGRSKCYMRLAKYGEAKEDAETVLKTRPKSSDAKMLIGEADYFLGDFEKAFLTFYRGHESRTNHEGLRCGHQMCRKAIDNSLKPDVPIVIDDEDLQSIPKLKDFTDDQPRKIIQSQYTVDIDFVSTLLKKDSVASVHQDCEYIKDYLNERRIFWRTQNPNTSKESTTDSNAECMDSKTGESDSHKEDDKASSSVIAPNTSEISKIDDNIGESGSHKENDEASSSAFDTNMSKVRSNGLDVKNAEEKTKDDTPESQSHQTDDTTTSERYGVDSTEKKTQENTNDDIPASDSH